MSGIEFCLEELIARARPESEFTQYGRFKKLARAIGVPRKVLAAILENRTKTISLIHLQKICHWLVRQGLVADLPGAMFRMAPSDLLTLLSRAGRVTMYVGEYRQPQALPVHRAWVAQADAAVASMFVELLSGSLRSRLLSEAAREEPRENPRPVSGPVGIRFLQQYIPSHITPLEINEPNQAGVQQAVHDAEICFNAMCRNRTEETHILIGSQRANYLVELFVAELFKLTPFAHAPGKLPFYLRIRTPRPHTPESCFGGTNWMLKRKQKDEYGICYRVEKKWEICPSIQNVEDAGIVILRREPGRDRTHLAVFGYSGQATMAMGDVFQRDPDVFWTKPQKIKDGVEVSIAVCHLTFQRPDHAPNANQPDNVAHPPVLKEYEIIPLPVRVQAKMKR